MQTRRLNALLPVMENLLSSSHVRGDGGDVFSAGPLVLTGGGGRGYPSISALCREGAYRISAISSLQPTKPCHAFR